jgi:adenine C2-methylase RlmN of 23S rRNA A2503 and tRNA A37
MDDVAGALSNIVHTHMNFFNLSKSELQAVLSEAGFERFRASQLFKMVYQSQFKKEFLPVKLQSYLKDKFTFDTSTKVLQKQESSDGTVKSLLSVGCQVIECKKHSARSTLIKF